MLNEFYHIFYIGSRSGFVTQGKAEKVKIIPKNLSLLTPLALAH